MGAQKREKSPQTGPTLEAAAAESEGPHASGAPTPGPNQLHEAERPAARLRAATAMHLEGLPPQPPAGPQEAGRHCGAKPGSNAPVWPDPQRRPAAVNETVPRAMELVQMADSMTEQTQTLTETETAKLPRRGRVGGAEPEWADCGREQARGMEMSATEPLRQDHAHPPKTTNRPARPGAQQKQRAPKERGAPW